MQPEIIDERTSAPAKGTTVPGVAEVHGFAFLHHLGVGLTVRR